MRIHQIRYHVDIVPYDIVWNGAAIVMIAAGLLLIKSAHQDARSADKAGASCHMMLYISATDWLFGMLALFAILFTGALSISSNRQRRLRKWP